MSLADGIRARRSIRGLDGPPLSAEEVEALVELALLAPAPHHTTPWRFAEVTPARRAALAEAMGEVWRADMAADGVPEAQQARALERSRRRVEGAPTLLLGCIVGDGLASYPDERRDRAEWTMAAHSFGAALQNLLLVGEREWPRRLLDGRAALCAGRRARGARPARGVAPAGPCRPRTPARGLRAVRPARARRRRQPHPPLMRRRVPCGVDARGRACPTLRALEWEAVWRGWGWSCITGIEGGSALASRARLAEFRGLRLACG